MAEVTAIGTAQSSPVALVPSRSESALNLLGQTWTGMANGNRAMSPTSSPFVTNNFSFPMGDKKGHRPSILRAGRPASSASSFKESYGFNLSPSLLIPGDYHQQMLKSESEKHEYEGSETVFSPQEQKPSTEGASTSADQSPVGLEQRSSTSTTESNSTSHSDSTGSVTPRRILRGRL